jgi:sulfite reductase beta subunit
MAFISSGYNPDKPMENRITDIGPQKYDQFYPPVIAKPTRANGCITKSANRCAGPRGRIRRRSLHRSLRRRPPDEVTHIREICEIADKHCDGHLRFTTRNNIEFMVDRQIKVQPLLDDLESRKFDGGSLQVPRRRHRRRRHQHRAHPGLDPLPHPGHRCFRSGQGHHGRHVRRLPGAQHAGQGARFFGLLPEHVRCRALLRYRHLGYHRKPPMLDHEYLDKMCEIPLAIASCPTAAIKPAKVEKGEKVNSVAVNNDRCMFCGNCYTMCPSMPLGRHRG